jgi:hypothetical protein
MTATPNFMKLQQTVYSPMSGNRSYRAQLPTPVAARPKAWVCGRSHDGFAGSNRACCMDVCLLCVVRMISVRRADHATVRILLRVASLSMIANLDIQHVLAL